MTHRKICVFTSTRADYGLLYWLLRELNEAPEVDLQILVSGAHLSPQFGETWRQIEADGFEISARVEMLVDADTGTGTASSLGLGVIKFGETLSRLQPDILVGLGDRYELLAVAAAAMCLRIPIAHIHGGEATEGLIDEAARHAVSAMAHIHFPAAEAYARRIIQMGNQPDRVFMVGTPALDNLERLALPDQAALEAELGFTLSDSGILVTYHPVTLADQSPDVPLAELLAALDRFPAARVLATKANADTGGRLINAALERWAAANPERALLTASLGQRRYLAALKSVKVMVGNSSSGIIEGPAAGCAVVNIGDRQKGRLRSPAVIDCAEERDAIATAIAQALSPEFQAVARRRQSPYGRGDAARRMAGILAAIPLEGLIVKRFHDLPDPS